MNSRDYARIFGGLNYAGAGLTFLAALGAIASATKLSEDYPYLLPLVLVAYLAGGMLLVVAKVGRSEIHFTPKNTLALTALYLLLWWWDLISILIGLPFIFITLVLGPLTVAVFVLSATVLGLCFIEEVLGYDVPGYISTLENVWQALAAVAAMVGSFLVVRWHFGRDGDGDWLVDMANDVSFSIRRRLQGMIREILRKHRRP